MLKRFLVLAAIALVAGCGSLGTSDPNALPKSLIVACESAAAAENAIAGFIRSGHIKPVSFPAIDQARVTVKAFCDPAAALPADLIAASSQVVAATTALLALKPRQ